MVHRGYRIVLVAVLAMAGCQSQAPIHETVSKMDQNISAEFAVPPRELLADVKVAIQQPPISLTIEQETRDSVTTGWKRFQGDFHIARHWQERTRYRIIVIPDSEEPMSRCRMQVDEETQQRAASVQEFETASYLHRPERAMELLKELKEKLPQRSVANNAPAAPVVVDTTWRKMVPELGENSPEVMTVYAGRAVQLMLRTKKSIHLPEHASPSAIVVTVISGRARMKIEGRETELNAGDHVVIPANAPHEAWLSAGTTLSIVSDGRWDVRWVNGPPTAGDVRE
jgi:quercetin dioxygenase-like cupin family protein